MASPEEYEKAREAYERHFGGREAHLGWQIITLSETGQPCDITFYDQPPVLDVTIDKQIGIAMMYGAGADKLRELLSRIRLSSGETIRFEQIWTVNPMPKGGIPPADLEAVDLTEGDEQAGPNGETTRQMIRETYHCKTLEEEDRFLRRFLAS